MIFSNRALLFILMDRFIKLGHRTFASLKIRNYRLYFIGQAISLSGRWMQTIALSWLVFTLTGSGTMVGFVTAAQFLPILLFAPLGGLLVDRLSKRRLLILTNLMAGILALVLGALVIVDVTALWVIFLLAFLFGCVTAIDNPARQTFALEMVGKDQLPNAISLNSTQMNMARLIGPAVAGIIITTVGIAPCFIFTGISYGGVLVALGMMRVEDLKSPSPVPRAKGQLREGFKYVAASPVLRDVLFMLAIIGTFAFEFQVSLPLLAEFTFKEGVRGYSSLMSAMGVGAILGGLVTANRSHIAQGKLAGAALLFGVAILLVAAAPTLSWAILGMVLVGFTSINFTSLGNVILQTESTPAMRGRVMALWAMAMLGSTPIGGPIVGWIGEHIGARWGLAVGGIAVLLAAGIGAMTLKKE